MLLGLNSAPTKSKLVLVELSGFQLATSLPRKEQKQSSSIRIWLITSLKGKTLVLPLCLLDIVQAPLNKTDLVEDQHSGSNGGGFGPSQKFHYSDSERSPQLDGMMPGLNVSKCATLSPLDCVLLLFPWPHSETSIPIPVFNNGGSSACSFGSVDHPQTGAMSRGLQGKRGLLYSWIQCQGSRPGRRPVRG